MNSLNLITGFKAFLRELNETTDKEYNVNSSSSIFEYSKEFKQYLHDSLNIDTNSIFSKSIDEIMDMKVVDGQLVDEAEYEQYLEENPDEKTNVQGLNDVASAKNEQNTEKTENDPANETNTQEVDNNAAVSETTPNEEVENDAAVQETNNNTSNENEVNDNEPSDDNFEEAMVDILNAFLQDDSIKKYLDEDQSGELNEKEVYAFLNKIKDYDKNGANISFNDVLTGIDEVIKEIKSQKENNDSITEAANETTRTAKEKSPRTRRRAEYSNTSSNTPTTNATNAFYSAPTTRAITGNYSSPTTSAVTADYVSPSVAVANTPENMSKEEIQQELEAAKGTLSEKQTNYNNIASGSDEKLNAEKQNVDNLYDTYLTEVEKVDENLKNELVKANDEVEQQKTLVEQKDTEITQQETTISGLEANYEAATTSTQTLKDQLSQLQSALSGADNDKKADIETKISSLQTQITSAETKEQQAKSDLDEANKQLENLQKEKADLEETLSQKEEAKTELENKVQEAYPQLQKYLDDYKNAKSTYEANKQTALDNAKTEVQEAQNKVNELQQALAAAETKETLQDYKTGGLADYDEEKGQSIANAALAMYGNNSTPGGYCGTGVGEAIASALGYRLHGDGYEWASNLENRDDWVEITDELTAQDLSSLPAGAVISWSQYNGGAYGHVCITDGQGHEVSDFTSNVETDYYLKRGATFRVFIPT